MANKRIFYACQGVAITEDGTGDVPGTGNMVHGLQSVGMTTNFNLEQAFELGQIEIYENIEGTPDVEVTLEKVLDGYPLIYHLATRDALEGDPAGSGLAGRAKSQSDIRVGIFPDDKNAIELGGANADVECLCSGMFVQSVSYTFPVDGSSTESVTLVGNNKSWLTGTDAKIGNDDVAAFTGTNAPLAMGVAGAPSGGVQQREDVMFSGSIMPRSIQGVKGGTVRYANNLVGDVPQAHIQNISISTDFGREDVLELGRKTPYTRPATFPIEVSCEIEAITTSGDFVFAYEHGDSNLHSTIASGNNTPDETIFVFLRGGYGFDLGSKNRLASVTYGGGDATGGNATCTYSYTNFNVLDVQDYKQGGYIGTEFLSNGTGKDAAGLPFPSSLLNL
jgi:hypothetical protein